MIDKKSTIGFAHSDAYTVAGISMMRGYIYDSTDTTDAYIHLTHIYSNDTEIFMFTCIKSQSAKLMHI